MEFGWISVFGAGIVVLMLIPNVVYALRRNKGGEGPRGNPFLNALEQIGRYACIVLMWLPLGVGKFGFPSVAEMIAYLGGNACLLAAYWLVFALYFKKKTPRRALILAVLPACIFLLSGLTLRHRLLVGAALLFAVGHVCVTLHSAKAE